MLQNKKEKSLLNLQLIKQQAASITKLPQNKSPKGSSNGNKINLKHREHFSRKCVPDDHIKISLVDNKQCPSILKIEDNSSNEFAKPSRSTEKQQNENENLKENQFQQILCFNKQLSQDMSLILNELSNQKNLNNELITQMKEQKCVIDQFALKKKLKNSDQSNMSQNEIAQMKQTIKNLQSLLKVKEIDIQKLKQNISWNQIQQTEDQFLKIGKKDLSIKDSNSLKLQQQPKKIIIGLQNKINFKNEDIKKSNIKKHIDFNIHRNIGFHPIQEEKSPSFDSSGSDLDDCEINGPKNGLRRRSQSYDQIQINRLN